MSGATTPPTPANLPVASAKSIIDYTRSLDCIHCGLCLHTCPTYQLTGSEPSSPRGRIYLMRAVAEGELEADADFAREMDFCLVCRHCESVCPAGVEFGAMMETTREGLATTRGFGPLVRVARWLGFRRVLPSRTMLRLAVTGLALAQRTGLVHLIALLGGARGRALRDQPPVPPGSERRPLPEHTPATGEPQGEVAMLAGCVMPELFGRVNTATARVLSNAGLAVRTAPKHVCCGALHAHNGDMEGARDLARGTIAAYEGLTDDSGEPLEVVVNSAGCGAHMKEYERVLADDPAWKERAAAFSARVRDLSEALTDEPRLARLRERLATGPAPAREGPLTFDDPCHLCHGQGVRSEPRILLEALVGADGSETGATGTGLVDLPRSESCCGSAGIYSVLRPADSAEVLAGKLADLRTSGAGTLVTANPGCHLQWETGVRRSGADVRVAHLAEVLAERLPRA